VTRPRESWSGNSRATKYEAGQDLFSSPEQVVAFAEEGTDAYRIWSGADGWVERLGPVAVCHSRSGTFGPLQKIAADFSTTHGLVWQAVLGRRLVHQPREESIPTLLGGSDPGEYCVHEQGLAYRITPTLGYSSGIFIDQRENRKFLRELRPGRLLNLFAYTCAFTVAAAASGTGESLSIDIARKALERGLLNLEANNLPREGHRVIADDVLKVLPRLERRGEKFDAVILDPPTFARRGKKEPFRIEERLPSLIATCVQLLEPNGWLFASTNSRSLQAENLETAAADVSDRKLIRTLRTPFPGDIPRSDLPTHLWFQWE